MKPAEIITLLTFLDELFNLGGKLIIAAIQKNPELQVEPLPELQIDLARAQAIAKIEK